MSADEKKNPLIAIEEETLGGWSFKSTRSHILHSKCSTPAECCNCDKKCNFCKYTSTLELPHLPEMVFPNNILTIAHKKGFKIEFNALDALRCVGDVNPMKVASSESWRLSRPQYLLREIIKPFDWTFSSDYKGTLVGHASCEETTSRIDYETLKQKTSIHFYQELMLYEDELHDNGIASCIVKLRVMSNAFFVLLRFFLRVDNVLVRINDTRIYHDFNTNFIIREYSHRESEVSALTGLPLPMFSDPDMLSQHVPLCNSIYEKFTFDKDED